MRDRRQDPNWERSNTDVPGYEWRDAGAATSAGRGLAGRWPRTADRPDEAPGPQPPDRGAGLGAGMYWSGESAREDEQMWRPQHDGLDPQRWHRQGFAGRGPRGYRRSDARIGEDVNDRLTDDEYVDASDVVIAVEDGVVLLEGTVDSGDAKRRVEDVAASVSGVRDVMNRLDVRGGSGGALERIGDALGR